MNGVTEDYGERRTVCKYHEFLSVTERVLSIIVANNHEYQLQQSDSCVTKSHSRWLVPQSEKPLLHAVKSLGFVAFCSGNESSVRVIYRQYPVSKLRLTAWVMAPQKVAF